MVMLSSMPQLRPEIASLSPYIPGRPIEEVAREIGFGVEDIVKLASNESPDGPFPGVAESVSAVLKESNRYPDNDAWDLVGIMGVELGVDPSSVLLANGSVALIGDISNAVGGGTTNVVYGWPSFVMYRLATAWAGSEAREVPLLGDHSFDLEGMFNAIDGSTSVVFVCNPNNPTGTVRPGDEVEEFVLSVPDSVTVVVDEAYHEFAREPYRSLLPLAAERPNLVVLRTFSKIYALAGLRIGYGVSHPDTVASLRKIQAPFSVGRVAQTAARVSLGQPDELARRVAANAIGRRFLETALVDRGLETVPSQTNFVFFRTLDENLVSDALSAQGVIVRPMSQGWIRVTVGHEHENRQFVEALDRSL